ncbi:MAG TPA: hypothetical protein PLS94_15045 [Prolixibacteraceae bacterium]|nr:hypothetical protein [Prolixibacteraceae bacterium]
MNKQLIVLSRVAAYAVLALGTVHLIFTFVLVGQTAQIEAVFRSTFLYMFVGAGLGCLLAGLVMLFSVSAKVRSNAASKQFFDISAIFILLLGIGAPIAMKDNPFGYIMLLLGIYSTVIAFIPFKKNIF